MILDDFAGPGGWDEGARLLGSTALILGREKDPDAVAVAMAAGHYRVECDVLYEPTPEGVEGYIASPPCQSFSTAGKGAGRQSVIHLCQALTLVARGEHPVDAVAAVADRSLDIRSVLVLHPMRAIREARPDWVAFEQVPPVLPIWQEYARLLAPMGYNVRTEVLRAEAYGVPQTRKRAILVAVKGEGPVPWPEQTHSRFYPHNSNKLDEGYPRWVSMAEALTWGMTDRPSMTVTGGGTAAGGGEPFGNGARQRMLREIEAQRWVMRSNYGTNGDPKDRGERTLDEPCATVTSKIGRNKWQLAAAGATARYTVGQVPRDLDQPAATITGKGTAYWTPSTLDGAHSAATSIRVQPTEAGVLQSFPADYPWHAAGTKTSQYQRVGDAIPPVLAAAILRGLLK